MTDEPGKYYPICSRCGEEMKAHQYAPAPGVCSDCYSIYDMDRFLEWKALKKEAQNDHKKD
jgi:hypothetical protein